MNYLILVNHKLVENITINIYDEERMLVELIRRKNTIPFDYYKEIISNYRKKIDKIDIYNLNKTDKF